MMQVRKEKDDVAARHDAHPFGWAQHSPSGGNEMALLALSHTPVEHSLYGAMLAETRSAGTRIASFSTRRLMEITGVRSYSAARRGVCGLLDKLSIEQHAVAGDGASDPRLGKVYLVFTPEEIFARRRARGLQPHPVEGQALERSRPFGGAIERLAGRYDLSRREAQVALCCVEGLSNAEIGERLFIGEQTVKFHLRHVFIKFGVRKRAELISRLLT